MATVSAIPQGMHTVTPGLTIKGCAEAIELYKKAFGAEEMSRVPDPSGKLIWHAMLRIGDSVLFLNDETRQWETPLDPRSCGYTSTASTVPSRGRPARGVRC